MTTNWGIISAGKISHDFVTAVRSIPDGDHKIVAVAARNLKDATTFASLHNIPKKYGSYEELANDPCVEVVYVGTIHPHHFHVGKLVLESKKHVLMEKPMTMNAKQTKELIEIARRNKCFLMEAVWSRFVPAYKFLMELLEKKTIGDIIHVNMNFGAPLTGVDRLIKKDLGGGTILDLGIYLINAVLMIYNGERPQKISAVGHLNDEGVDVTACASFLYTKNRSATITSSVLAEMSNDLVITGTKGLIKLHKPMWCATKVETPEKTYEFPLPDTVMPCNFVNSSGLRYEAMEVRDCLKKGLLESPTFPLKDSLALAEIMDEMRQQIGVVYPED